MTQQSIERTYTTSEQSKLLKEKGFDLQVCRFYTKPNAKIFAVDEHGRHYPIKNTPKKLYVIGENFVLKDENAISAPEQWQVCEWLRLNHGIWISVDWMTRTKPYHSGYFCHLRGTVEPLNDDNFIVINHTLLPGYEVFTLPQEAYSAAITYCLEKIIK